MKYHQTKMKAEEFAVICLFVILGMVSATPSQAVNFHQIIQADRQCQGFKTLGDRVTQIARRYRVENKCQALSNCSGIKCNGKGFGNTFNFSLAAAHCVKPIHFWMHLVIPNYNINETRVLQDGQKTDIFENEPITFGPFPITVIVSLSVTPRISKKDNNITLGASICFKVAIPRRPLDQCAYLPGIQIPTSPRSCPGTDFVVPFKAGELHEPKEITTKPPKPGTKKVPLTKGAHHVGGKAHPITTRKTLVKTTKGKKVTKIRLITSHIKVDLKTTQKKQSGSIHTKPHHDGKQKIGAGVHPIKSHHSGGHGKGAMKSHGKDKKSGLSTGATVGLVSSMILILLLAVGLIAYLRRLKQRRPAYYSDSTVTSYDKESLVDGHLVL